MALATSSHASLLFCDLENEDRFLSPPGGNRNDRNR